MLDTEQEQISFNAIQQEEELSNKIKNCKNPESISLLENLISLDSSLALKQNSDNVDTNFNN